MENQINIQRPILSIVIPVFNVEHYVKECLDSILCQDLSRCEIIAVDDGSTDKSYEILLNYQKKYPDIIKAYTQSNGRQSKARNRGVSEAKGRYIYFIDSDDYVNSGCINSLLNAINKHPEADVFQLDYIVNQYGQRVFDFKEDFPLMTLNDYFERFYNSYSSYGVTVSPYSFIYSRPFLQQNKLQYKEGLRHEDRLFLYNLVVTNGRIKLIHLDKPFYVYRIGRPGSTTTALTIANFTDRQYIWREGFNLFISNGKTAKIWINNLLCYALYVLGEAASAGFDNEIKHFYSRKDALILRNGILTNREKHLWILSVVSPKLSSRYLANKCPSWQRRLINLSFSILSKFETNYN